MLNIFLRRGLRLSSIIALGSLAGWLVFTGHATAEPDAPLVMTYVVDRTDDATPIQSACTIGGISDCSLRGAILAANASAGPDIVELSNGLIYQLTIDPAGSNDINWGDLNITDNLTFTVTGAGCAPNCRATVESDQFFPGPMDDRLFEITNTAKVWMTGLTLQLASHSPLNGGAVWIGAGSRLEFSDGAVLTNHVGCINVGCTIGGDGGGFYNLGTLVLRDALLRANSADDAGGGIFNGPGATLRMNRTRIERHTAANGGGVYSEGWLTGTNVVLFNNSVGESGGGLSHSGPSGELDDSAVYSNTAYVTGGGLQLAGPNMTLFSTAITGNVSFGAGGGVYVYGTLNADRVLVGRNRATFSGGGVWEVSGTFTWSHSAIVSNTAGTFGGGMYADSVSPSATTLTNTTVSDNAASYGGGIFFGAAGANTLSLNYVTIASNSAITQGGGLRSSTGARARNTLIGNNSAPIAPDCQYAFTSFGYNLVESTSGCTTVFTTTDITGVDPMLGPLQINPGTVIGGFGSALSRRPLAGSPAIDAASPVNCFPSDQRGFLRPFGAACDIGAIEAGQRVYLPSTRRNSAANW